MPQVILIICLICFCTQVVNAVFSTTPQCLGLPADLTTNAVTTPQWWFLFSKQSDDNTNGGGFIYMDSFGTLHDVPVTPSPQLSIKIFWERHINRAYANNEDVYEQCVTGGNQQTNADGLINTDEQACQNNVRIEAQAWYHDILGRGGPTQTAEDSDHDDINDQEETTGFRHAHAKYVSLPIEFLQKPLLTYLLFYSNVISAQFQELMTIIGRGNPRLTRTNFIDEAGNTLLPGHQYNIQARIAAAAGEENQKNVRNTQCTGYYAEFVGGNVDIDGDGDDDVVALDIEQGATQRERQATFIRNPVLANFPPNTCISTMILAPGMTIYGFDIRAKPGELFNPGLDTHRAAMLDSDIRKDFGEMLSVVELGIDPFTYIAMNNPGIYYVSTYSQPRRVDVPSIYMSDRNWGIFSLRGWEYDGEIRQHRHEKLSFSQSNGRVCIGDANRNLVHTLYAGIYICFDSQALADKLYLMMERVDVSNSYIFDLEGNLLLPDTNEIQDVLPETLPVFVNRINTAERSLPSLMYPLAEKKTPKVGSKRKKDSGIPTPNPKSTKKPKTITKKDTTQTLAPHTQTGSKPFTRSAAKKAGITADIYIDDRSNDGAVLDNGYDVIDEEINVFN
ncbi:hypothetical protein DFA_10542 [Cavenderia fasciculata]|uniref:Uncharacterized protein n=1 Tax=Cavenderia fasciculata TaxID=261658 RepID=F4QAI1_CACFS|nr:uncharacterized protein DFA_10542 [Cavenderia fasciculata]EGG15700.1 hypothetical protein DFA_10542 [Cavenderia fasciculata]|eukprot:XP_004354442.1 hypothetical protein DFA_10542 [Cavenderia fasciculata]